MTDIKVLTADGEFELTGDARRLCALTLEDGVLFEYVSTTFNSATHDSNNRLLHICIACVKKFGPITRRKVDEGVIRRIYEYHTRTAIPVHTEVDNLPLEQSTKIFLDVVRHAIKEKAVDIHWIIRSNSASILFRIHGRIERIEKFTFDRDFATGLLGAIYGSSKDVTDGSFSPRNRSACSLSYSDPPVAIRWQTIPTGDSQGLEYDVVLRVTNQDPSVKESVPTLQELGYLPDQAALLTAACNSPGGIVMSGMTGSGKTTALRSLMQIVRGHGDKKIYTVEDPIELKIYGATQISARGHNVAEILHSLLRGDLDVAMVGEIRNNAVASAMETIVRSGHKMLTTIHAPSALAIISRLSSTDIGIQRETLAEPNFISALVYQMLMPVLCPHCRIPATEQREKIEHLAFHLFNEHRYALDESSLFLRNHAGCRHCRKGISGMTICAEVVRPTHEMNKLLRDRKDTEALLTYRLLRDARFDDPRSAGKTAYEVAIYKASQGLIDPRDINDMCGDMSLQEILRGPYETGGMV